MAYKFKFISALKKLFPIARSELAIFLPLIAMMTLITLNYNILKLLKDAWLVPIAGAEVIPFCKVWVVLPMAVVMTAFFSLIVYRYGYKVAFYLMISFFLSFYALFALWIYPNLGSLAIELSPSIVERVPEGLSPILIGIKYWPLCLLYGFCEIWSTAILSVLFWGVANRVVFLHEAKRFYGLFALAGNSTGILAPLIFKWAKNATLFTCASDDEKTIKILIACVCLFGLLTLVVYRFISGQEGRRTEVVSTRIAPSTAEGKKPSFVESLLMTYRNKYVLHIAMLVIGFNVVINITEVVWKNQVKALYTVPTAYGDYMSWVMLITGATAVLSDLFLCNYVLRRFSWLAAALVTPLLVLGTSLLFFGSILLGEGGSTLASTGLSFIFVSTTMGSLQNILVRGSKYSLFDASKEMAYIPLSTTESSHAKSAIDGVVSRLGKSGGSILLQIIIAVCGSIQGGIAPIFLAIVIISILWIQSAKSIAQSVDQVSEAKTLSMGELIQVKTPSEASAS